MPCCPLRDSMPRLTVLCRKCSQPGAHYREVIRLLATDLSSIANGSLRFFSLDAMPLVQKVASTLQEYQRGMPDCSLPNRERPLGDDSKRCKPNCWDSSWQT